MKLESLERTTIVPISQPRKSVMTKVRRNAVNGVA